MSAVGRLVSGGQTGVDRAALDAALRLGLPHGGWCPAGGVAEDGPGLLERYAGLRETASEDSSVRTEWNVRDSDATLVLGDVARSPGTAYTVQVAHRLARPVLVADAADRDAVRHWLAGLPSGCTLNVAGPRESEEPGVYGAALALLLDVLG